MAAKRSKRQLKELSGFVQALYELGGYGTWAEFADDAGVHRVSISEWKNGGATPDGYNVLRLIRASAARAKLTPEASALETARATGEASAIDREILRRLSDISAGVAKALDLLAPDGQASGEAPQSPDRKSG